MPLATVVVIVVVWEAAVHLFKVPAFLLPAPSVIWRDCVAVAGNIGMHTAATMNTIMLGFIASIVISLPLAVLITSSPAVASAIYPILVFTQSIPKVALAPLLVVMLGANELPRVVITFLIAFFPLVISIATGLLAVPPELLARHHIVFRQVHSYEMRREVEHQRRVHLVTVHRLVLPLQHGPDVDREDVHDPNPRLRGDDRRECLLVGVVLVGREEDELHHPRRFPGVE